MCLYVTTYQQYSWIFSLWQGKHFQSDPFPTPSQAENRQSSMAWHLHFLYSHRLNPVPLVPTLVPTLNLTFTELELPISVY